jgi:hypothetical protein
MSVRQSKCPDGLPCDLHSVVVKGSDTLILVCRHREARKRICGI